MKAIPRFLSVILALAMIFSLTTAALAADDAVEYPTMKLKASTDYNLSDANGQFVQYICDYITEHTDGAITWDIYFGGSYCSDSEALEYCQAGELDMAYVTPAFTMSYLPQLFTVACPTTQQEIMDGLYWNLFENEETAKIIDDACAEYNVVLAGYSTAGTTFLFSNKDVSSFEAAAAAGVTVGSPINLDTYEALGLNTVTVDPNDFYEALSRGVCDAIGAAASVYFDSSLDEVIKNASNTNSWSAGNNVYFNRDMFQSLPPEVQQIFLDAVHEMSMMGVDRMVADTEALKDVIEENGGVYTTLNEEDADFFCNMNNSNVCAVLMMFAENLGCADDMATIIDAWNEHLGLTITY